MYGLCTEVLHSSYTMGAHGSPDIYTLSPRALGVYIRQTTRAHGITSKYIQYMYSSVSSYIVVYLACK